MLVKVNKFEYFRKKTAYNAKMNASYIEVPEEEAILYGITNYEPVGETAVVVDNTEYNSQYLTFVSLENDNTFKLKTYNSSQGPKFRTISVSVDNGQTWQEKTSTVDGIILGTINKDEKLLIKGTNESMATSDCTTNFESTGTFNVIGNIMSLVYGDNFIGKTELTGEFAFRALFRDCTKLKAANNLILPATTLSKRCYFYMFENCSSMEIGPKLPATELSIGCYERMFKGCRSLKEAPKLPAMSLVNDCYEYMFQNCTSLKEAPVLSATVLASNCYFAMFHSCTGLKEAPELPATTLASNCYNAMFSICTSLTKAPELPAMILASNCYANMFYGCALLKEAPELPATTLAFMCYNGMFSGCKAIQMAPELPASKLVDKCYDNMFNGCINLKYIKCLATDLNEDNESSTFIWVKNVFPKGMFIKVKNVQWELGSENGIPNGWDIVELDIDNGNSGSDSGNSGSDSGNTSQSLQINIGNTKQFGITKNGVKDYNYYVFGGNEYDLNVTINGEKYEDGYVNWEIGSKNSEYYGSSYETCTIVQDKYMNYKLVVNNPTSDMIYDIIIRTVIHDNSNTVIATELLPVRVIGRASFAEDYIVNNYVSDGDYIVFGLYENHNTRLGIPNANGTGLITFENFYWENHYITTNAEFNGINYVNYNQWTSRGLCFKNLIIDSPVVVYYGNHAWSNGEWNKTILYVNDELLNDYITVYNNGEAPAEIKPLSEYNTINSDKANWWRAN